MLCDHIGSDPPNPGIRYEPRHEKEGCSETNREGLKKAYRARNPCNQPEQELMKNSPGPEGLRMFFTFPEDARWNDERQAVEFGVELASTKGCPGPTARVLPPITGSADTRALS